MGSIDAAVDAGSRRRVGTDMVRNAGKGEKEYRVCLSLLLTGLNERRKEGSLFVRSPPHRRPRSFGPGAKSWLNCSPPPNVRTRKQEERGKRRLSAEYAGLRGGNNNFWLMARAGNIHKICLSAKLIARVRSCSCVREGIIGPPPPRRRLSLPGFHSSVFACQSL